MAQSIPADRLAVYSHELHVERVRENRRRGFTPPHNHEARYWHCDEWAHVRCPCGFGDMFPLDTTEDQLAAAIASVA